jgi:hypothetical protein
MSLQRQVIDIPLAGGLRQELAAELVPPGQFLRLQNYLVDQAGKLTKRQGYQALDNQLLESGSLPPLEWVGSCTTGAELLCAGDQDADDNFARGHRLYGWSPEVSRWIPRRPLSAVTVERRPLVRCAQDLDDASAQVALAESPALRAVAWIVDLAGSTATKQVHFRVDSLTTGAIVVKETWINDATSDEPDGGLVCFAIDDYFFVGWTVANRTTGATDFRGWRYNFVTRVADGSPTTYHIGGLIDAADWDAAPCDDTHFGLVWVETGTPGSVKTQNFTIAGYLTVATTTFASGGAAAHAPTFHSNGTSATIGCIADDLPRIRGTNAGLSTSVWGPNLIDSAGVWSQITVHRRSDGLTWAAWRGALAATSTSRHVATGLYNDAAGAAEWGAPSRLYHQELWSRPFQLDGRTCLITTTYDGSTARLSGYSVIDLEARSSITNLPRVCVASVAHFEAQPRPRLNLAFAPTYDTRALCVAVVGGNTVSSDQVDAVQLDCSLEQPGLWRACEAQGLLVLTGGQTSCYDGRQVVELGFAQRPRIVDTELFYGDPGPEGVAGDGNKYLYRAVYAWRDGRGNIHYSEPSDPYTVTVGVDGANTTAAVVVHVETCTLSRKDEEKSVQVPNYVEILFYRTEANPAAGAPYYQLNLFGSKDNLSTNARAIFTDNFSDADLVQLGYGSLYTDGGVLPDTLAPPSRHACVHKNRLWLADAERQGVVWFSKLFVPGEAPRFPVGGEFTLVCADSPDEVTALASLDDNLAVFTRSRVYLVSGDGPGDTGLGGAFQGPSLLTTSAGCVDARSVVSFEGGVFFLSADGLQLLTRDGSIEPVGQSVREFLDRYPTCLSALVDAPNRRVIWLFQTANTSTIHIVFDYQRGLWSTWLLADGSSGTQACGQALWGGMHWIGAYGAPMGQGYQESAYDGPEWPVALWRSAFVRLGAIGGYQRIWRVVLSGTYRGSSEQRIRFYTDDQNSGADQEENINILSGFDGFGQPTTPLIVGVANQKCRSISVEVEDGVPTVSGWSETEHMGVDWYGLTLEIGQKPGVWKGSQGNTR